MSLNAQEEIKSLSIDIRDLLKEQIHFAQQNFTLYYFNWHLCEERQEKNVCGKKIEIRKPKRM